MSLSNYPMGAENDSRAPYNQEDPEEEYFDVTICQTLSKVCNVGTFDYIKKYDEESNSTYYDFSEVDWSTEVYNQVNTPLDLIKRFKEYLTLIEQGYKFNNSERIKAGYFKQDCDNWIEDDIQIIPD